MRTTVVVKLLYHLRVLVRKARGNTYGWCLRCGRGWDVVQGHHTWYGRKLPFSKGTFGCFPLCEDCWRGLATPARRLPYYRKLWDEWMKPSMKTAVMGDASEFANDNRWDVIRQAVEEET